MAAAAALAFCASSTKAASIIGTVTNSSPLSISLTVSTNVEKIKGLTVSYQIKTQSFATKDILNLLSNADFANTAWPKNSKLVVGLDEEWSNDVLVVDSTGTNVLYDATHTGNTNAFLTINFYRYTGTWSESFNGNNPGSEQFTFLKNGYFELYDNVSRNIDLWAYGACTETFSLDWNKEGINTTWSDSETFDPRSAAQTLNGYSQGSLSGTITADGHGKGTPETIALQFLIE